MDVDVAERHIAHELESQHNHARDPEEDDVESGHEHARGIIFVQRRGRVRPAEGGKGPESG